MFYLLQNLLAFDQGLNTLTGGYADETISSRTYRNSLYSHRWDLFRAMIDRIFSWLGQSDHCRNAWLSEMNRTQSPPGRLTGGADMAAP